jgi:hypothetical protein
MKASLIFIFLILAVPLVEAVEMGVTSASGIVYLGPTSETNTTVRTALNYSVGEVAISGGAVTLRNATLNNSYGSVTCAVLTFTVLDEITDTSQFPQISAFSGNVVTISNPLTQICGATVNVSSNNITPSSPRVTYLNGSSESPAYSFGNNITSLSVSSLPSGNSTVYLDGAGPTVSLTSPSDGSVGTGGTVHFSYSPIDDNTIANCSLLYGGLSVYTTSSSIAANATNTFVVSGIDGNHPLGGAPLSWSVSCTDEFGNAGYSATSTVVTITSTGGGTSSGGGGSGGGGAGGSGGGSSVNNSRNSSVNTTLLAGMNASVNTTRALDLQPGSADRESRRNFVFVVIGASALLIAGIGLLRLRS